MQPKKPRFNPLVIAIVLAAVLMVWSVLGGTGGSASGSSMAYSTVVHYFESNQVTKFSLDLNTGVITMTLKEGAQELPNAAEQSTTQSTGGLLSGLLSSSSAAPTGVKKNEDGTETVSYKLPYARMFVDHVSDYIAQYDAANPDAPMVYDYVPAKETIPWMEILFYLAMLGCTGFLLFSMMRGGAGGGGIMNVGKAKVKDEHENKKTATFADVAGEDEEKEELKEVVEFLKSPDKFNTLGARIPHGVLLVGPPGTGKTLLARACAGEAGVPFYSISGSDFVEMYVGVGASRVRDLFDKAKKTMPCIIFIDEIDAVGRQRGAGLGGGHDEREQTLNQLLVEMDGFEANDGIIVMAATNRADILDKALLRPGRFDRQVTVDRPDVRGREQILRVHAENKPMDEDVKFEKLAQMTVGFTGADLANLLNESALLAARRHRSVISMDEVEESMERVIAGPQRKGRVMTEAERTTIAYHESGHALVGHILEHSDPVHKISIVSRGQALGYTLQLPQEDHFLKTKNEMLDELAVFLGGRVAEELMCDDITSGASNDLERATKMAREMVTRLGMSEELGTQVFGEAQHQVFLGRDYADHQDYSEETARRIDIEVQRIMREAHRRAVEILDVRRDQLDLMAKVLLERETVEGDAVNALLDNEWDAYLEREGDILAAKEERNAKAAGMPTKKRAPRMSEEELAADAAAFAQAAMQEDAEVASDDAGDDCAVNADADADK